jgi:DNA helicase-2/ATP-dependent DNA helicase PcrA
MVVGDDDQTIYEWRGARPEYILKEFETTFTSKPHSIFKLDTTFRFGPLLAQYAYHTISLNRTRQTKNVFANQINKSTDIEFISSNPKTIQDTNDELSKIVIKLVNEEGKKPDSIRVIARLYSQFTGLESAFIKREIPYKIEGNIPFFKRREVKVLIDYSILFESLYSKIDDDLINSLINIINTPNRKINKVRFESSLKRNRNLVLIDFFDKILNDYDQNEEKKKISDFVDLIINGEIYLNEQIEKKTYNNSDLFNWIYTNSNIKNHYLNYYGDGEEATDKINTIKGFIQFCNQKQLSPKNFSKWINKLDTTRGYNDDNLIIFSTVHKTKGLEFDYVVIPDCIEGNMPFISTNQILIFNRLKPDLNINLSDSLESERRLFYVAITRAMNKVFIGTTNIENTKPSRFLEELDYTKTKKTLEPIVENKELDNNWFNFLKSVLGKKKLIENTKIYLNRIGKNDVRKKVDDMSINVPEDEFSYINAYPSKKNHFESEIGKSNWKNIELS